MQETLKTCPIPMTSAIAEERRQRAEERRAEVQRQKAETRRA